MSEKLDQEEAQFQKRLGMAVRVIRNMKGMTLDDLEVQSGVSKGNLSKIENDGANITISTLRRLAVALGTDAQGLLNAAS